MSQDQQSKDLTARKQAIINQILLRKEEEYASLMGTQQEELLEASHDHDEPHNPIEDGKVDQVTRRVELRSGAVESLAADVDTLKAMNYSQPFSEVKLGAVIETDQGNFLVAVPANEFEALGKSYKGISTLSPLFKALEGKGEGDSAEVEGTTFRIKKIF